MVLMRSPRARNKLKQTSLTRKPCIRSKPLPIHRPSPLPALRGSGISTYFQQRDKLNNLNDCAVDNNDSFQTYNINNSNGNPFGETFLSPDVRDISNSIKTSNLNVILKVGRYVNKRNNYIIPETNEQVNSAEQLHTPTANTTLTTESHNYEVCEEKTYRFIEQAFLDHRKILENQAQNNNRILNNANNKIGKSRHNKRKKWKLSTGNSNTFPSIPRSSVPCHQLSYLRKLHGENNIKLPPIFSISKHENASVGQYINLQPKTTYLMQNQNTYDQGMSRNFQYTDHGEVTGENDSSNNCPMCQMTRNVTCQTTYGDVNEMTQRFPVENSKNIARSTEPTLSDHRTETNFNNTCPYNQSDLREQYNDRLYVSTPVSQPYITPNSRDNNNRSRFNEYNKRMSLPNENIHRSYQNPFVDHYKTYEGPKHTQQSNFQPLIDYQDFINESCSTQQPLSDLRSQQNSDTIHMSDNSELITLKRFNDSYEKSKISPKNYPTSNQTMSNYNTPQQWQPVPHITKNIPTQKLRTKRNTFQQTQPHKLDNLKNLPNSTQARENQPSKTKLSSYTNETSMMNMKSLSKDGIPLKHGCCTGVEEKKVAKERVICMCKDFSSDTEYSKIKKGFRSIHTSTSASKLHYVNLCHCPTKGCNCRYPPAYNQLTCAGNMSGNCNCSDNN